MLSYLKNMIFALVLLIFLSLSALSTAAPVDLPRTGQTTCYDEAGATIDCAGTGQDGDTLAGVAWPNPRFTNNGDGTITDNLTGLMWLQDGRYLWPGNPPRWSLALNKAALLNTTTYAGYDDWRLPNIVELESLYNAAEGASNAWLHTQGFSSVSGEYWSSTTLYTENPYVLGTAWTFGFTTTVGSELGGVFASRYKNILTEVPAWAVRTATQGNAVWRTGQTTCYNSLTYYDDNDIVYADTVLDDCADTGQDGEIQAGVAWPSPRFTDQGDGTVADNLTDLVWLKDANCINSSYPAFDGDNTAEDGRVTWQHALDFVAGINNGTYPDCGYGYLHTDWRLPNRKELFSLIDFSAANPDQPLPPGQPFTNVASNSYWSSTTRPNTHEEAIFVSMALGDMWGNAKTDDLYVWPVRTVSGGYPEPCQPHSADYNQPDRSLNLSELLRAIQFYNIGEYHCDSQGEDGFGTGAGDQTCTPHDSDYNLQDWKINLSELLRLIQLYNIGGYHCDAQGEDGYAPTTAAVLADLEQINLVFDIMENLFAPSAPTLTEFQTAFGPYVADDLLHFGATKTEILQDILSAAVEFVGANISIEIDGTLTGTSYIRGYWIRMYMTGLPELELQSMVFDGSKWFWYGNRLSGLDRILIVPEAHMDVDCSDTVKFDSGFEVFVIDDTNFLYNQGARSAIVIGPGLPSQGLVLQHMFPQTRFDLYGENQYWPSDDVLLASIPDNSTYTFNFYTESPEAVSLSDVPIYSRDVSIIKKPLLMSEINASFFPDLITPDSHDLAATNIPGILNLEWINPTNMNVTDVSLGWGDGVNSYRVHTRIMSGEMSVTLDSSTGQPALGGAFLRFSGNDATGRTYTTRWNFCD